MRPHRLEPESIGTTPHQLVLEHEQRLAHRREEARRSATEVEKAKEEAARIRADAARNAEVQAREQSEEILAAARAQAERITADGRRDAADLTATTRAREEADVAWVLDRVIPGRR